MGLHGSDPSRVKAVIVSASWRRLWVLTIEQLAFAVAVVVGGGIVILLLGTQILDWPWLELPVVAGIAIAVTRIRHRMLSRYQIAQVLDERLRLDDSLSTAWFLLTERCDLERGMNRLQIKQAEQLADSINPTIAFPLRRERGWVLAIGLSAVFVSLFITRYVVQHRLNFEQSLIPFQLSAAIERLEESLSARTQPGNSPAPGQRHNALDVAQEDQHPADEASLRQNTAAGVSAQPKDQPADQRTVAAQNSNTETGQSENSGTSGRSPLDANTAKSISAQSMTQQQAASNALDPSTNAMRPPASLLNRMEDAVSGLLGKMGYARNSDPSRRDREPFQNASTDKASSNDHNQAARGNHNDGTTPNQTSETTERPQAAAPSESSRGRGSNGSSANHGSDAQSGIGSQDGDKQLKEAEQLRAMGKLAEIIGKRSASLTGEVVVETSSGKQQLKTQYSQQVGRHSDLGGEINRDEIPLIYQQYVREYMEQVHKQPKK
ncbi:MAG: hypothetical protein JOY62_17295 [Acidobacteriaceae bacterium]|nr:hypothetical protein [Acidobacteriaceae bacterium]MBV9781721.1 hypothetical protein [Acidobacteriaceae bacterium]